MAKETICSPGSNMPSYDITVDGDIFDSLDEAVTVTVTKKKIEDSCKDMVKQIRDLLMRALNSVECQLPDEKLIPEELAKRKAEQFLPMKIMEVD